MPTKHKTLIECSEEWYRRVIVVVEDAELTLARSARRLEGVALSVPKETLDQLQDVIADLKRIRELVTYNKIPF